MAVKTTELKLVQDYDRSWIEPTPFRYGTKEDNVLVLQNVVACPECGGLADQRMSYVWKGTTNPELRSLHVGASVKHYFTVCRECRFDTVS